MAKQHDWRLRVGVGVLFLAAMLLIVGTALRGMYIDPAIDPVGFSERTNSALFVPGWLAGLIAGILLLPGYLALYATMAHTSVDRPAFWGMILGMVCVALAMPLFAFMAFGAVTVGRYYSRGQIEVIQVAIAVLSTPPASAMLLLSALFGVAGGLSNSLAIWRSGLLPRWSAVPFALGALLANFPVTFVSEMVGTLSFGLATSWIAWTVWRGTR